MTLYSGGAYGSICQLSFITEASTVFVNGRQLLAWHHFQDSIIYIVNGLLMTVAFFWVRVVFYGYMIFGRIRHWHFFEPNFYETSYPDSFTRMLVYFCITLYSMMYGLQLFWFYKILTGLLKALGLMKSSSKSKKAKKVE